MNQSTIFEPESFDIVHDCQQIFKTMMMAMAFPGKVRKLNLLEFHDIPEAVSFALQPMLTLLDLESSYHIYIDDIKIHDQINNCLAMHTTSEEVGVGSADFILCLENSAKQIFSQINTGTLFQPDHGATIIYGVDEIVEELDPSKTCFSMTGPGIKDQVSLAIGSLDNEEPVLWQLFRGDYPKGIDIFLISQTGDIVGIPRSVKILRPRMK